MPIIFNIRNQFEVLNLIDRKPEKLWNKIKDVVKMNIKQNARDHETEESNLDIRTDGNCQEREKIRRNFKIISKRLKETGSSITSSKTLKIER